MRNTADSDVYEAEVFDDDESQAPPVSPQAGALMVAPQVAPAAPVAPTHTREEIEALKDTLKAANREMTDAQFKVFMAAAQHLGLDPLARQIVPIFQSGRMTVQTTIDGFRLIAERTRKYRGQVGPFWCGPDGKWREVWLEDGAPAAARVGVLRSDFDGPMWGVARTKSYAKGGTWNTMPDVMIAKVAESLALRKAFPAELSGAYTREELGAELPMDDDAAEDLVTATTAKAPPATHVGRAARDTGGARPTQASVATATDARDGLAAQSLRELALEAGIFGQDYARELHRICGKKRPEDYTEADREKWRAHLVAARDRKRAAEAKVTGGNGQAQTAQGAARDDDETYDLRELPTGAGAH